jgi:hypothetical protein
MTTLARVDGVSEHTLARLIKWGALLLVVLVGVFALVYYRDSTSTPVRRSPTAGLGAEQAVAPQTADPTRLAATYQAVGRIETPPSVRRVCAPSRRRTALLGKGKILMNSGDLAGATAAFTTSRRTRASRSSRGRPDLAARTTTSAPWRHAGQVRRRGEGADRRSRSTAPTPTRCTCSGRCRARAATKAAVTSYQQALAFVPTGWCEPTRRWPPPTGLGNKDFAAYAAAMTSFCKKPDRRPSS